MMMMINPSVPGSINTHTHSCNIKHHKPGKASLLVIKLAGISERVVRADRAAAAAY